MPWLAESVWKIQNSYQFVMTQKLLESNFCRRWRRERNKNHVFVFPGIQTHLWWEERRKRKEPVSANSTLLRIQLGLVFQDRFCSNTL